MSWTQWLAKPSYQVQGFYADIECNQATRGLLGNSKNVHGHQNTERRTGNRLKRRHHVIFVSSFFVWRTRVSVSFYVELSREAEVMVAALTRHTAAKADAPYEQKRVDSRHARFLTNGPRCVYTVFQGWSHNMLSSRVMRRCWNPTWRSVWSSATHWFHIRSIVDGRWPVWRAISRNKNPHSR